MARVELRVINSHMLEELPPVCMFCGIGVKKYATVKVAHGNLSMDARLPLCKDDQVTWLADLKTRFAHSLTRARPAGAAGANLLVFGAVAAGHLINASRDTGCIPVDNVDPRFVRALKQLRKQRLEEFEQNLIAGATANSKNEEPPNAFAGLGQEPGAETVRPLTKVRPPAPTRQSNLPLWIGGGVLAGLIVLVCMGAFVIGFLRAKTVRQQPTGPAVVAPAGPGRPAAAPGGRPGGR